MPQYQFHCNDCGHEFGHESELLADAATKAQVSCPKCASKDCAKLFSGFSSGGCCSPKKKFS